MPALQKSDYDIGSVSEKRDTVFIKTYVLSGNTLIDKKTIETIVAPFVNRFVSFEELSQLRDLLTLAYVQRGYISSGAQMPRVNVESGTLEVTVVEGALRDVTIQNEGRLKDAYILDRVGAIHERVVNINEIERELQKLQQNKRIKGVKSQLLPSETVGESTLTIDVEEEDPISWGLRLSNHNTPSSGATLAELSVSHLNLSGSGDTAGVTLAKSEGRSSVNGFYEFPLTVQTDFYVQAQSSRSEIIEDPFSILEIESKSDTYAIGFNSTRFQSIQNKFDIFVGINYRKSESFLLGSPFSFSAGVEDGVAKIAALEFGQFWQSSHKGQAIALRSTFNVGSDILGATSNSGDDPDGQFTKWLGQAHYARRFTGVDAQLSVLMDVQWADRRLLGLEKYAIGGHASARGYRENSLLFDEGAFLSAEWRQHVWRKNLSSIALIPFFDIAYGEDEDFKESLSSAGLGFHWHLDDFGEIKVFWAKNLDQRPDGDNLQDQGVHASLGFSF